MIQNLNFYVRQPEAPHTKFRIFIMPRGRPSAPLFLVPNDQLLDPQQIRGEILRLADIARVFVDNLEALKWLARRRLVANTMACERCREACSINRYGESTDGYRWYCKECGTRKTVRAGSFFSLSRLTLENLILLMYCWARDFPQKDIRHECGLAPTCSESTIVDWCNFCRDVCEDDIRQNPEEIGGINDDGTATHSKVHPSGHSYCLRWMACVQQYSQPQQRRLHTRNSQPFGEFCRSRGPRDAYPVRRKLLDACQAKVAPSVWNI